MSTRRMPLWVQAPAEPIGTREIRVDASTTPARLTARVIAAVPRFSIPAALLSIIHQLGEALVPVLMGIAIELAVSRGDLGQLLLWVGLLAGDFAMLSFSWRFGSRIGELGMLAVQHRLRSVVSTHLLTRKSPVAPGVALSLATSDVNRLADAVMIGVFPLGQLAAVGFGGTMLLVICWPLGLMVLLGAPSILLLTDRAGRVLRRRSQDEQGAAASAAGEAADLMAGYRVIKGVRAETEASHRYRHASRTALASTLLARKADGLFVGAMDLVTGLFVASIALAAGLLAFRGAFGIAELITIVGLTQFLLSPLQSLSRSVGRVWAAANASAERLLCLLREDAMPAVSDASLTDSFDGSPAEDRSDPVRAPARAVENIAAIPAEVGDGEFVAISADPATAVALLELFRASSLEVLVVPHDAHLFAGSVRENVALPGVPEERVEAALEAAGCAELASILPNGWDTAVGEGGAALSGGQRQRVALARALATAAPFMVLHDPTTAVDAVTEAAIGGRLRSSRAGKRTVIITRSPVLLHAADRVVTVTGESA